MPKFVNIAFTGVVAVTPSPSKVKDARRIEAVLPSSRKARYASNGRTQIDAHFAFVAFDHGFLVEKEEYRAPDFRYPTRSSPKRELCFLDREVLVPHPVPTDKVIEHDLDDNSPNNIRWAAIWNEIADAGKAVLRQGTLSPAVGDYVRFESDVGKLSSRFVCERVKVDFRYGNSAPRDVAHEIVLTLTYDDEVPTFALLSTPFGSTPSAPKNLVFTWADSDTIEIVIANGSLSGINALLAKNCMAHEHESRTDREFEIIYDVIDCKPDGEGRRPVPHIEISEIRQIPCIATLV